MAVVLIDKFHLIDKLFEKRIFHIFPWSKRPRRKIEKRPVVSGRPDEFALTTQCRWVRSSEYFTWKNRWKVRNAQKCSFSIFKNSSRLLERLTDSSVIGQSINPDQSWKKSRTLFCFRINVWILMEKISQSIPCWDKHVEHWLQKENGKKKLKYFTALNSRGLIAFGTMVKKIE